MWCTFRPHICVNLRQKKVKNPLDPPAIMHFTLRNTHKRTHACKHTPVHKVPPAASGRLNHALIKPWSEFELGHYPLTVINAVALLGGQRRRWGRDAHHTYRCWHKSSATGGRIVYTTCMDEVCIVSLTRTFPCPLGEDLDKRTFSIKRDNTKKSTQQKVIL